MNEAATEGGGLPPGPSAAAGGGRRPAPAGPVDGFLLLDKPSGVSSFRALAPLKRLFRGSKVGHAGTLDPAASGLLLVGIGRGTRLLEYLEGMPKAYAFTVRFGLVSDSYDMEGKVAGEPARGLTREAVEAALTAFRGRIRQAPPAFSAIKVEGRRAYDLARAGEALALPPREVEIHSLVLLEHDQTEGVASLRMECSKGTYVRSLAHDLGAALGCGALADHIRRLAIGPFRVEDALPASAVDGAAEAPNLLPLETAVAHLSAAQIPAARVPALRDGRSTAPGCYTLVPGTAAAAPAAAATDLRVLDPEGRFLAIATLNPEGHLCPKKVLDRS